MKWVAVTVVENQADVIEAFVRHHAELVDGLWVFDRQSRDGTRGILQALQAEGLRVALMDAPVDLALDDSGTWVTADGLAAVVRELEADVGLPLRADEFLVVPDRAALERWWAEGNRAWLVRDYCATTEDDAEEADPVARIAFRKVKPLVDERFGGSVAPESAESGSVWIARFALRSPVPAALAAIRGALTAASKGAAHVGLDTHFRLGFQLLAEDPARFFDAVLPRRARLEPAPVARRGGALRHTAPASAANMAALLRGVLPMAESLAALQGRWVDWECTGRVEASPMAAVQDAGGWQTVAPAIGQRPGDAFRGFTPVSGWERREGPVAAAYLPEFHWALAPEAVLAVAAVEARTVTMTAELLTYAPRQVVTVLLNGVELQRLVFAGVNQKEPLELKLMLEPGENRLVFRQRAWIDSAADPRKLGLIFLSLQVDES